jgi:hypothetical protein
MPIKSKRGKIGFFYWGKVQQMLKVDKKKRYWTTNMSFGVYNKASRVFK